MKVCISIITLLTVLNVAQGQTHSDPTNTDKRNILRFTVPAKNDFLDERTEIISFSLRDDTVFAIHVIPGKDDTTEFLLHPFGGKMFYFDLCFEADRLVFAKKYPEIPLPVAPPVEIQNTHGQKNDKLYKIVGIRFYRDSTEYTYGRNYDLGPGAIGTPPQYKGDIGDVAAGIAGDVAAASIPTPFDSVLVFQAVVRTFSKSTGYGIFELEGLRYGTPSAFSEIVAKHLLANENNFFDDGKPKWIAGWIERPISTRVKVYVRLGRDGSVSILLPKRLGNFTGD